MNMMWVDAIAKFHFEAHFQGQKSDVWSIVEKSFIIKPVIL